MPMMKLTPNAAMRARDVSRPRAEHLAEAEASEARGAAETKANPGRGGPAPGGVEPGRPETGGVETGGAETGGAETGSASGVARDDRAGRPGFPRRRRGPHDVTRRGGPSR
ncbi:MAG: hypothetical protein ACRDNT_08705 [Streptosporangiaceae bacterium]